VGIPALSSSRFFKPKPYLRILASQEGGMYDRNNTEYCIYIINTFAALEDMGEIPQR
jgi:hypothetical protein